jgi:hypothetical protein
MAQRQRNLFCDLVVQPVTTFASNPFFFFSLSSSTFTVTSCQPKGSALKIMMAETPCQPKFIEILSYKKLQVAV